MDGVGSEDAANDNDLCKGKMLRHLMVLQLMIHIAN